MQNWRHNDIQHVKSEAFPYFTVIFHSLACDFMYVLRHLKNGDGDGTVLSSFAQRPHRRLLRMRLRHFLAVHMWRIATTFSAGISVHGSLNRLSPRTEKSRHAVLFISLLKVCVQFTVHLLLSKRVCRHSPPAGVEWIRQEYWEIFGRESRACTPEAKLTRL